MCKNYSRPLRYAGVRLPHGCIILLVALDGLELPNMAIVVKVTNTGKLAGGKTMLECRNGSSPFSMRCRNGSTPLTRVRFVALSN